MDVKSSGRWARGGWLHVDSTAAFPAGKVAATAALIFGAWEAVSHWLFMVLAPLPGMLAAHLINFLAATTGTALITTYFFRILRRQNRELRELDWRKNLLANAIVHDLRQPLSALVLGLRVLREEEDIPPDKRGILLAAAQSSSTRLLEMVGDLLDVAALDENQPLIAPRETAPEEFIAAGTRLLEPLAAADGKALKLSLPDRLPRVKGDAERLTRVVANLVGNAIKFAPAGGAVTVSARLDDDPSRIRVSVADTGPGVPAELRDRLFEKFARAESGRQLGRASTGLGLYFCKLVVEAHGGRIWLEPSREAGAVFTFSLPVAAALQGEVVEGEKDHAR